MISKIKLFCTLAILALNSAVMAQNTAVEMADGLRSSGKIYVVVAVILTTVIGLFLYLYVTDRKISRLEKEVENSKK